MYEIAKFLAENQIKTDVLVPKYEDMKSAPRKDYLEISKRFDSVSIKYIDCIKLSLPLNYHLYFYPRLPGSEVIYFPYSIYDHFLNIITKRKGQIYVIAAHSMHLKNGYIIAGHRFVESVFNWFLRNFVLSNKEVINNVYYHVINLEEAEYLKSLGIKRSKIIYIPTFIDVSSFEFGPNSAKRLQVVHIGGKNKNAEAMLDIITALGKTDKMGHFDFYFVGKEQPKELERLADFYSNIHCLNEISDYEKIKLLRKMDIMIVPAIETFSRSMLEGLASGLYIMANGMNPAAVEIKKLGGKMSITNGNDTTAYVTQLERLFKRKNSDRSFYSKRFENHSLALKYFDKKIILNRFLAMFNKLLD